MLALELELPALVLDLPRRVLVSRQSPAGT